MSRLSPLGCWLFAITLAGGCTSHHGDEPIEAEREREPEPEPPVEGVTPASVEPEPVVRGPITPLTHKPFTGAVGDVDGDHQPDVVALCHDPEAAALIVLRGAPDGTFVEGEPLIVQASGVVLGDLDGDADLDALLTNARGRPAYRVALNDGTGSFSLSDERTIPGRYGGELDGATLIDLDDDGRLDAVIPLWDSIHVLPGDGSGGFESSGRALTVGRDPFDTAIGDLDGDGQLDLIATSGAAPARDRDSYESSGASVWIFRGNQRGFDDPVRVEIAGAREVELGDLDDDGKLEIVVSGAAGLTTIDEPLGELEVERIEVATDGPLAIADILVPPGPELITSSYMQSRIHALAGPDGDKTSFEAGNFVVGLYPADVARGGGRPDVIVLNAGPSGGPMGPPAPSIEVLFAAE
ncbi:MAG TPA: VCBS repeat-containing protein [Enhygromyxa sp.]|nr:VCBS repeat-containing protein [Enhygromyxa sp.]